MLELRHLRSFCVLAEEGHVTRAAKRLNIAQPALTQQMKTLEMDLGARLFRRVGRGVEITAAGRYLQKEAQSILEQVHTICEKTREMEGKGSRSISVGISDVETVAGSVTDLLRRYRETNPQILVKESILDPKEIAPALRDGRVDAAFSCAAVPDRHDLTRLKIGTGPAYVALPLKHPMASKEAITLEELTSEPLILLSHGEVPGSFEVTFRKLCTERGLTPHLLEITPSLLLAMNKVASDAGIALLPVSVVGLRSDAIAYIPLAGCPELVIEFALYLRRRERSPAIVALKDLRSHHHQVESPKKLD